MTRPIGGPNNHNINFIIPFPSCPYMVHTKYDQAIDYDDRLSNNVFYKYTKHEKNLQIPAPDFIYHSFFQSYKLSLNEQVYRRQIILSGQKRSSRLNLAHISKLQWWAIIEA